MCMHGGYYDDVHICIYSQSTSRPATDTNALELIGTNKYIVVSSICPRSSQSSNAYYYTQHAMQRCCVFFYCTKSMDTRTYVCMLVPGCMHVSLGRARGKGAFCSLIPVTRIIMHVPAPSSIPLVASICMHACMRVLPCLCTSRGRSHCQ